MIDATKLNLHLLSKLDFLEDAFGVIEKLETDGYTYPAIYKGDKFYENVLPDIKFGNYVFHCVKSPANYSQMKDGFIGTFKISSIFWLDIRTISEFDKREKHSIIANILNAFRTFREKGHRIASDYKIYDEIDDVYDDFDYDGVNNLEYFMHPYLSLKVEFELEIDSTQIC